MVKNYRQKDAEMRISPSASRENYDRLYPHGLLAIVLLSAAFVAVMTVLSIDTGQDSIDMTQTVIKHLGLSTAALFPSGHALRDPIYLNPAIDLRHGPNLPSIIYSPEEWMHGGFLNER
jgi:hypothetical protein